MDTTGTAAVFKQARAGDSAAWSELVERFSPLMRSIARRQRLSVDDASDVVQTVWLSVVQHADSITDPDRLVGWLSTSVRRESWRVATRAARERPVAEDLEWQAHRDPGPEDVIVSADLTARLGQAIDRLPERQRTVLRALLSDSAPCYEEVADALEIPVGSIGPTRARALVGLRRSGLLAEPAYAA